MTKTTLDRISRRRVLQGIGGAAAASTLAMPHIARAQAGGKVIVGTWGGDYQNLQIKHVADPILKPKNIEVLWAVGGDPERKTKLLAEKRLPRGTVDIVALTGSGTFEMWQQDVLQEIDYSKLKNANVILPQVKTKYSIPHIYTGRVILYNPAKINPAPTSYADLWNPKYAGKVGVIDIQYQTTIESAAMVAGGTMSNYEPGKAKLLELKKMGIQVVPTNEAMAQALKNEEIWMCIMWKARGVQWQNAGVPVQIAAPKEGLVLYISEFAIAKNAPNKDAAHAYLDATLEQSAQLGFAESMGYNGTISGLKLPEALERRIGFTEAETKTMLKQDYDYLAKNDAGLKEWWDKVFKA
jgi:putative spermidine/putrescine transport system substrate-binding protein